LCAIKKICCSIGLKGKKTQMKSKSTQLKRSGEIEKNKEKKRGRMQRKNLPYMTRSNKMTKTRR